jgi:hypothetical protein
MGPQGTSMCRRKLSVRRIPYKKGRNSDNFGEI